MKERSVTHSTFVIERSYPVTPQKVFAAFADPAQKRRWFAPDPAERMEEFEMDFRVGGSERKRFTFNAGTVCENRTIYQVPTEKGTDMIFTEQAAFFEASDGPEIREKGWSLLLDRMGSELVR